MNPQKNMARTLTKKRKGFVRDYLDTGIGTLAVKKNYNVAKDTTAGVIASQLLDDPQIQEAIADALPDALLAKKHLALLNKMQGDEIDVNAVKYGLEMAYKIKGTYAPEKSTSLNVIVEAQISEEERNKLLLLLNDKSGT
jgi:hypothetical protein